VILGIGKFTPEQEGVAIAYLSELYFADQFLFINDGYGLDWLRALDAVEALVSPALSAADRQAPIGVSDQGRIRFPRISSSRFLRYSSYSFFSAGSFGVP
jgi:hypothetical protein